MEEEDDGGGGGWLISYADLMTLLFATFVVLYGIKPEGETKEILGVTSSIREAFVEVPDEIPEENRKGPILEGVTVFKYFKADQMTPPIIKKYRRTEFALNIINTDFERVKNVVEILTEDKIKGLRKNQDKKSMSVHKDDHGFTIRLVSAMNYKPGRYRLEKEVLPKIKKLGDVLKNIGRPITIEGHTDSTPPGGKMSNWELSALRATYLARYMIKVVGFSAKKVSAAGYADTKPVLPNLTKQGRYANRRVEIKVRYDHEK